MTKMICVCGSVFDEDELIATDNTDKHGLHDWVCPNCRGLDYDELGA